jgi:hypothetical protein
MEVYKRRSKEKAKASVIKFLELNGWSQDDHNEWIQFYKQDNMGFDVDDDEVVVIGETGETGDIAHFNIDSNILYTLLGYMFHNRLVGLDYKWVD